MHFGLQKIEVFSGDDKAVMDPQRDDTAAEHPTDDRLGDIRILALELKPGAGVPLIRADA